MLTGAVKNRMLEREKLIVIRIEIANMRIRIGFHATSNGDQKLKVQQKGKFDTAHSNALSHSPRSFLHITLSAYVKATLHECRQNSSIDPLVAESFMTVLL